MINVYKAKKFCKEDISRIENYDKAIADKTQMWCCHHRNGLTHSAKELQRMGMYYDRSADELIFLTESEHHSLHGKNISVETRKKISAANKGKPAHNKGKTMSTEQKRKISEAHTGKPKSTEHRRKMADAKKGHTVSEETRRKLSEANKAYWARRKAQEVK